MLLFSPLRVHNCPAGSQQQQSLLPRHQPVHHGRPGYLHGISYGHPQQHHALRELRPRDASACPVTLTQPPTPANWPQPNSEYQNQCTSLGPSLYSLSLSIYRYTCIRMYIYSKLCFSHWCCIHTYPSHGPITLTCAGIQLVQYIWGGSLFLPTPTTHNACSTTSH